MREVAMTEGLPKHYVGRIEGDFVVLLIGMRINKPWKVHKWWPVFTAMPRMLKELRAKGPEAGLLGHSALSTRLIVQYWRSFEHLEACARSPDQSHWPAWAAFNKANKNSREDVGIWHETYVVPAGQYEAIYSGVPLMGLAKAAGWAPIGERNAAARQRIAAQ
jgi:hypothetical protein